MLTAVGDAFFDTDTTGLVKPIGIALTGVDSKSFDTMMPGEERPASGWLLAAQPDTRIVSSIDAVANERFMESPQPQLNDEPISSPQADSYAY
jgi:hypothetical protein